MLSAASRAARPTSPTARSLHSVRTTSYSPRSSLHSLLAPSSQCRAYTSSQASVFAQSTLGKCPSCSTPLPTPLPVCPICHHIEYIPANMSYHEVMGLHYEPNPFHVDPSTLRPRFLAIQRLVHPDRWATKSPVKGNIAARVSETVNTVYDHLTNPFLRVAYILEREGVSNDSESILDDPTLVLEVMEVREALEQAQTEEEVEEIRLENHDKIRIVQDNLADLVAQKSWQEVAAAATRLKYLQGIEQAARAWPSSVHDH